MIPAEDPQTFLKVVDRLRIKGAHGVLVSGGADKNGEVPVKRFLPAIGTIKEKDPRFKVIVHTGLVQRETAAGLKHAMVDQLLIDVIGDDDTIREVYHLNKRVQDYEETLRMLKEMSHRLALTLSRSHFGESGEWGLEIVTRVGVGDRLVIFKRFKLPG
jgi:uncharacterized radical SAM superfamily protein